jgi:hypothetical protein
MYKNSLYLLDSENFKVYFFIMVCPGKKILATVSPKLRAKKSEK